LLWRKQDAGLLGFFANQIRDPAERDRAWQRYHKIREFAESPHCRHRRICAHFGETPKWNSCGACDVCGTLPEWLTLAASRAAVRQAFVTSPPQKRSAPVLEPDADLREYLREWRRKIAREEGTAAFVVLHDTTLDEICRIRPSSIGELLDITGIGERKAAKYGKEILNALRRYGEGARAATRDEKKTAPAEETVQLLTQGKTLAEIAQIRGRQLSTVVNSVAALVETGQVEFQSAWIDRTRETVIKAACARLGLENLTQLKPLKEVLPPEITYEEIRLVVAQLKREQAPRNPV